MNDIQVDQPLTSTQMLAAMRSLPDDIVSFIVKSHSVVVGHNGTRCGNCGHCITVFSKKHAQCIDCLTMLAFTLTTQDDSTLVAYAKTSWPAMIHMGCINDTPVTTVIWPTS